MCGDAHDRGLCIEECSEMNFDLDLRLHTARGATQHNTMGYTTQHDTTQHDRAGLLLDHGRISCTVGALVRWHIPIPPTLSSHCRGKACTEMLGSL